MSRKMVPVGQGTEWVVAARRKKERNIQTINQDISNSIELFHRIFYNNVLFFTQSNVFERLHTHKISSVY